MYPATATRQKRVRPSIQKIGRLINYQTKKRLAIVISIYREYFQDNGVLQFEGIK